MSSIDSQLSRAYELIEADRPQEAKVILEPLLDDYPDNADLWWLYAHSVEDETEAQRALSNVLRINPDYDGAQLLLTQAHELKPPIAPLSDRLAEDDLFADDDDDFLELDDDFDDLDDDEVKTSNETTSTGRSSLIGVILVAIFLIILILVVLVINPFGSDDDDTPEVANNPTATAEDISTPVFADVDATETVDIDDQSLDTDDATPEIEEATSTITSQVFVADYVDVINALSALNVISDDTTVIDTQLGSTLLISICTGAGDDLRANLTQGMTTVSAFTADIAEDAVGFRLIDCENDDMVLNVIATPLENAAAFSEGAIDEAGFRSTWQPVG